MKLFFKILAFIGCMAIAAGLMMATVVAAFSLYLNVFWKITLIPIFLFISIAIYLALFSFKDDKD